MVCLDTDGDGSGRTALFAVFDGHSGGEVSTYCARHIVRAWGPWGRRLAARVGGGGQRGLERARSVRASGRSGGRTPSLHGARG